MVNAYFYVEYAEYYDYSPSYPEGEDGESSDHSQGNIQSLVTEDLMTLCIKAVQLKRSNLSLVLNLINMILARNVCIFNHVKN